MAKTAVKLKGPETAARSAKEKLSFSRGAEAKVKRILKRYPAERQQSAVIPLLKLAQDENNGWLPTAAMEMVAERLSMPYIRVYEVATFYTMFNLDPVGKFHLQVCTNCSCMIRGSDAVVSAVKDFTGITENGATSNDNLFTLTEVECLGACVEAPVMQVNNGYYTHLTKEKTVELLNQLKKGKKVDSVTPTQPMKDGY